MDLVIMYTRKLDEIIEPYRKIPEKHLESFDKYIRDNPERVIKSKQFQAFPDDYNRFGMMFSDNNAIKKSPSKSRGWTCYSLLP